MSRPSFVASSKQRSRGLSRVKIAAAAVALADREGLEALSMRALGRELGVQAMSLYRYVSNKDDLLDAMQAAMVAEMRAVPRGLSWTQALEAMAREFRQMLARHPRTLSLFVRPAASDEVFAELGRAWELLDKAGFSELDSLRAMQSLLAFVVGQAMWQFTPEGERAADDEFEFGLRAMLLGFEAMREG